MSDNSISLDVIDEKMKLFDKYLERSHMDKKAYQYDGVKWCLKNELLQPLLLEKEEQNKDKDKESFAPLFPKVDILFFFQTLALCQSNIVANM